MGGPRERAARELLPALLPHACRNLDHFTHEREGQLDWHRNFETSRDEGYTTDLIGREAARFVRAAT